MSKQLLMFPEWWHDPELWYQRPQKDDPEDERPVSDLVRPTEVQAIDNIYMLTMMKAGKYRLVLSELELEVDDAMTGFKRARSGYPEIHYIQQVAMKLRMPQFQVRSILDEIAIIKRNIANYEDIGIDALPIAG